MTAHAPTEPDLTAEARIVGIANGTPNPVSTILRALKAATAEDYAYKTSEWQDLAEALVRINGATDDEAAMDGRDDACEALTRLLDYDYDLCGQTPNQKWG